MTHKLFQLLSDNARADRAKASIRVQTSEDVAHVYVYDVIDSYWGASAKALVEALDAAGDKIVHLHVNSPGGDVFEARAMVSAVRARQQRGGKVVSFIDGLAASAATYLSLAGDQVHIADGGMFMVHNSWTLAWGNKAELRSTADLLDKIDGTISADYARKTGATAEQIATWMEAETWFTGAEALAAGFVDSVIEPPKADDSKAARWNLSAYANVPKAALPAPPTEDEISANAVNVARLNRSRLAALLTPN
jgi:ATP-dependent Clp protease protease subunit